MADFAAFVAARSPALLRSAWLLTGDTAAAQDRVQTALLNTWRRWATTRRQHDFAMLAQSVYIDLGGCYRVLRDDDTIGSADPATVRRILGG